MPWEFTEHHIRPEVFFWSPKAYKERNEVKTRRQQAQDAYVKAKKAVTDWKYQDAEKLLQLSVAAWPDNPKYSLALGDCLFLHLQDAPEAIQWYDGAVRLADTPLHRTARARCLSALGRLHDALLDVQTALQGEPEAHEYMMAYGMLLERLGRYPEAAQQYSAALPLLKAAGQSVFNALFNRGFCYKLLGRVEEAVTDLEAAQQLVTTSMSVRTVLGVLYIAQHKYAKALDAFSVVLQQQSSSPAAANNAALAAYLTVTADFDDSSPATRAASIQEQRRRAAAAGRGNRAKQQQQAHQSQQGTTGAVGSGGAGSPSGGTLGSPKSADASRDSSPNRPMAPRVLAAMASLQLQSQRPKREPNVRVLLDERLHAEEFGAGSQSGRGVGSARSALSMRGVAPPALAGAGGSSGNLAPGTAESTAAQYEDVEMSDDDDGGNGEPIPVVTSGDDDPQQWALDIVRGSEDQTVSDPEKMVLLEQAAARLGVAMCSAHALSVPGALEALLAGPERRTMLDADTRAVAVGEAGDIPSGLLLMVVREGRTPGTAVVHEREVEEGELLYNRGLCYLALGRLAEAGADLDGALAANPHHAHYPYYQAVVCARRGDDLRAVEWEGLALRRNPSYLPALYHLGLLLHVRGENREAIQRLDMALTLAAEDWKVMEARGRVLQELDRHSEALPTLQDALRHLEAAQPPAVRARLHFAVAQSAVAAHLPHLLRDALSKARINGQDPASVYNLRGMLCRKERRFQKALRYLSMAIASAPRIARLYYDRAQCYIDMALWPEAIDDLTASMGLMPNSALLFFSRGLAHFKYSSSDPRVAEADLAEAHTLCGGYLRGEGPLWESNKFMSSGGGSPDLSPSLAYHLGCARGRLGCWPAAVEALAQACVLLPGQPVFMHEYAKALQSCGRCEEAVVQFSRVLMLQPSNARALTRRGLAYKRLKQYSKAAADFETAKRLEPNNPLLQIDYKALGGVDVLELCRPGEEAEV